MTRIKPLALAAVMLLCSCASRVEIPPIPHGDTIAIAVAKSQNPNDKLGIRNEALGSGVSTGTGTGMVAGGLWGLACGPLALLCVPLGAMTGALTGSAAGAVVGVTGALSAAKADRLRERMGQVSRSHPMAADLQRAITERARKYWTISPEGAGTKVNVEIHEIQLMSTRDEQIRCVIRVSAWVDKAGSRVNTDPVKKQYEYLGAYSPLSVWLDEGSDFVDTILNSASQQLAAQIVADLALR